MLNSPVAVLLLLLLAPFAWAGKVQTYPIPAGVDTSNAFTVQVRSVGCPTWKNVTLFRPRLAEINFVTGSSNFHFSSLANFDFTGPVEISATYNNGAVSSAQVRPASLRIQPQITASSNTVTFQLSEPSNVFLQVNDDVFDGLHLMTGAAAPERNDDSVVKNDTNTLYFGPGLHVLPGVTNITSGQTMYLAGGAVVRTGGISFTNVTSASIRGRGVLLPLTSGGRADISVIRSRNIQLQDFVALDVLPRAYEADNVLMSGLRVLTSVQWGDGIDVYCSKNVVMDKLFMRTSDDSIALYAHRNEWYGNTTNVTLSNSALWADVAHPINIGTHGNPDNPEIIGDVAIRNIDIMDHREGQVLFQGCIALNAGDENLLQNILIEDVRVENFRLGQLINFRVMKNSYNTAPGRGIRNVTVRNLSYAGNHSLTSIMAGYNENRTVSEISFQNLTVNGQTLNSGFRKPGWYLYSDFIPMFVNEHTSNITYT